jgi:hypothetical protein
MKDGKSENLPNSAAKLNRPLELWEIGKSAHCANPSKSLASCHKKGRADQNGWKIGF